MYKKPSLSLSLSLYKWSYLLSRCDGLLYVEVDYNLELCLDKNYAHTNITNAELYAKLTSWKNFFNVEYFQEACIEKIVRFISGDDR